MTVFSFLVETVLKATLLLAAAGLVVFALRNATASFRHFIWSCSLVGALAVPALTLVIPRWPLGIVTPPGGQMVISGATVAPSTATVPDRGERTDPDGAADITAAPADVPTFALRSEVAAPKTRYDWTTAFVLLWLGGVAVGIITLVGGLVTLGRLARRSRELTSPKWIALVHDISTELGIDRPVRAIIGSGAAMPATWGFVRPTVLLPADAEEWDDERRRVVLLHELAHVRRNDSLVQLVAQLSCIVYWFHPAVWYAAQRLRSERELACDEHVLGLGVNACDYAAHLLEIATRFRAPPRTSIAAVAMARPSQLEGRLVAILSGQITPRFKSTARVRATALAGLVAITLPLAAMRPWKMPPADNVARVGVNRSLAAVAEPEVSSAPLATVAAADTFRWQGVVPPGKWVEVMARYSDIRVELAPTGSVEVIAIRRSGAANSYRIAMENVNGGARFCVVADGGSAGAAANETSRCEHDRAVLKQGVPDTRVDFVVKLPAGVGISAHTGRGNITADGVQSYVWGTSGRGDIRIVTTDLAEANAGAGSIYAEFSRRSWRQNLEFLTDQGDITVVAPGDANMMVEAETSLGAVTSEFGGRPTRFAAGQQIMMRTGERGEERGGMLTLRTGRGRVELKRGPGAVSERSSIQLVYSDAPVLSVDPKPNDNPNPDDNPNPNPDSRSEPNPNPNPPYDADENPVPEIDSANAGEFGETGERLPVSVPAGFFRQFSDATIRSWPDARAIARLRDIAATHVKQHHNDYVRERSEWALTLVRNGEIVAPLRTALSSGDWRERAYAAWALATIQDERAIDALIAALGDSHWRVRMHAAAGLHRSAGAKAVSPLIGVLNDPYWQVRIAAVDALMAIGDRRAVPSLQAVADGDARSIVRDQARSALQRMSVIRPLRF